MSEFRGCVQAPVADEASDSLSGWGRPSTWSKSLKPKPSLPRPTVGAIKPGLVPKTGTLAVYTTQCRVGAGWGRESPES